MSPPALRFGAAIPLGGIDSASVSFGTELEPEAKVKTGQDIGNTLG